ncbi:MAG TPA: transposase, partial [Candidatus Paceibacterota bacterium]|nr:transposase [Candidatus Paceibacterota bacterium]
TKGRKPVLVEDIREATIHAIKSVALRLGVKLLEIEAIEDHVHLLIRLRQEESLPSVMRGLKGASAREILKMFPELAIDMKTRSGRRATDGASCRRTRSEL